MNRRGFVPHRFEQFVVDTANFAASGLVRSISRRFSHCSPKFSTSAEAFGSASMRSTCAFSTAGVAKTLRCGRAEQFVVRHAAPQKVGEPGRQLVVIDIVDCRRGSLGSGRARCGTGSSVKPAHASVTTPDRLLERIAFLHLGDQIHHLPDLSVPWRAPIGAGQKVRDDLSCTGCRIRAALAADKNLAEAGRPRGRDANGPDDVDIIDIQLAAAIRVELLAGIGDDWHNQETRSGRRWSPGLSFTRTMFSPRA